jgi:phenylalanyl-tRNA synthetase beta chain
MLVVGEPMHAFDLDLVEGGELTVRAAGTDEAVATLDGQTRTMVVGELLIADSEGPTSIAGVMGGARSEVSESTSRVLLEAAIWDGPTIHDTSVRLALRSEASGRFEKGLAPVVAERAQAYASVLFEEVLGVKPQSGTIDVSSGVGGAQKIKVGEGLVTGLLGYEIPSERLIGSLERLDFEVQAGDDAIEVVPPPDRRDVQRAVDVVEEVARIDGLDRIPATLPEIASAGGLTAGQSARRRLADSMVAEGFFEIAGWSFASPGLPDALRFTADDPARDAVAIENPMSEEESRLRTTLLGSLLDSAARNAVRGAESIRLFELGYVYLPAVDALADQRLRLGALIHGPSRPASWREPSPPRADVFAGSAVLGSVLSGLKVEAALSRPDSPRPFLHPGRSADVSIDGAAIGWVGEVHPLVASQWDLPGAVVFEVDVAPILAAMPAVIGYRPLSSHPAVRQDLAVTVGVAQSAAELKAAAFEVGGPELESVEVFDVYSGEQVGEGRVSIGLRLSFRAADRTLTEEEASAAREAIAAALTERFGGEVRG